MRIASIISAIESFAPPALQEKWDNTGLQVGSVRDECSGVLLCVDVTEDIIREAADRGCNLVVSHHPLIFRGLKNITGATMAQRAVVEAIRRGISVYSCHTALDSTVGGISYAMAAMMGAKVMRALSPCADVLDKITVYVPRDKAEDVRLLLLDLGSGIRIGAGNTDDPARPDRSDCLSSEAESTTLSAPDAPAPAPDTAPGFELDELIAHRPLTRVETVVPRWRTRSIVAALQDSPLFGSQELSVEVTALSNNDPAAGLGVYAVFDEPLTFDELTSKTREVFGTGAIRISSMADTDATFTRIALCGGSGGEFIPDAIRSGAQAYISADIRYHDFAEHGADILIMDVGHFESESCSKDIFYAILTNKFPNFAVYKSELEKNPVKYLI